jgi:glycosyltransferase involved in cell wall biosynthesis
MLSIRDANALAQQGQYFEAASIYAKLLFAYPDLSWSTIVGLKRCLNNITIAEGWAQSTYEFSTELAPVAEFASVAKASDHTRLLSSIDQVCQHPCATLLYKETPTSTSDILLGLLHRLLWKSRLVFPLPLRFAASTELEKYVAKYPLWSYSPRATEPLFLIRLGSMAHPLENFLLAEGSHTVIAAEAKVSRTPENHLYQLRGAIDNEEVKLLCELVTLIAEEGREQNSLLELVDLLVESDVQSPVIKNSVLSTPAEYLPKDGGTGDAWIDVAVHRGLFCDAFYRRTNPDLSPDTNLRSHFISFGWREGRDPSQYFSVNTYLEIYRDVAASGTNPLEHYVCYGSDRSRFPSRIFERERSVHGEAIDLGLVEPPDDFALNKLKIAILLHIHYPDVLHDILPHLVSSAADYDLLITATSDFVASDIHAVTAEYPLRGRIRVRVVQNRGRDIGAFVNEFTDVYQDYDLICKLHGKKSPHLDHFGRSWRRYLIAHTIGNDDISRRIAFFFTISPQLGVFAPVPFMGTNNSDWAGNLSIARELVANIDREAADLLGQEPLRYPSATVFWFRPESLADLYRRYPAEFFPSEPLPVDGTVAHALERLIPFFAMRGGYQFGCYRHRRSHLEWSAEYPILTFLQAHRPVRRRKVLLFSHDASNTGAPRTAIGLHRALNTSGDVDCLAVVLGGGPLEERFHEAGPSLILPNGISLEVLAEILEIAPRDVSLICNTVVTGGVVELARNYGLHVVSLVHEYASAGFWPQDLFRKALEADVCVFPGTSVLEAAVSFCGKIPAHNCLLRPQGLYRDDFPRFSRAEVRDLVLSELGLGSETTIVMGCGMLENRKGFDIFIDTAECMLNDVIEASTASAMAPDSLPENKVVPQLAFLWVGSLPHPDLEDVQKQLDRIASSPDLSRYVHLLGQVPEADRYFAAADLFFLSSRFDPFPGVVLEAMAAGMPIVCFREATDVTDAFIPPCGGYALNKIDPSEAASVLLKLALNPSLRMEMGDFARRRLRSHYSFASYTSMLLPHLFNHNVSDTVGRMLPDSRYPFFSIVVPAFRTPLAFLQQLIFSVLNQSYPNFELIIAGSELDPMVAEFSMAAGRFDGRVKPIFLERNLGISGNTNAAIDQSSGTHVCFLDHDDLLHAHCLLRVSDAIARMNPDFIFTDEDKVDSSGVHFHSPVRKPGFNQDLLERNNYITHFTVVSRRVLDVIGGVRSDYDGAQDYDFILRATDASETIWHIPEVLYHWRESEQSTSSGQSQSKPYAVEAGRLALEDHLLRLGRHHELVENSDLPFVYKIVQKAVL